MSLVGTQVVLCHTQMCNMQHAAPDLGRGRQEDLEFKVILSYRRFGAIPGYNETLSKPKIIIKKMA